MRTEQNRPSDAQDRETLVKNADAAMSRAKGEESCFRFFEIHQDYSIISVLVTASAIFTVIDRAKELLC